MKWTALLAPLLLVSLAGCSHRDSEPSPPFEPQCVTRVCLADPNSADAKRVFELYGLHQITQSSAPVVEYIEGDLAVWEFPEGGPGNRNDNLVAYSLLTKRLIPITVEDDYHATRALADAGRVIFSQQGVYPGPDAGVPQYLALWAGEETGWHRVQTGLEAEHLPEGFDWPWATFTVQRSENNTQDGMWAINLETGWKSPIGAFPRSRGSVEYTAWSTVTEGVAYYTVRNETADNYRFVEQVLPDGLPRVIDVGSVNYIDYDASGRYVSWLANGEPRVATVYDRTTGLITEITTASETATDVRVGGDWVVFNVAPATQPYNFHIEGYHIPTKTRHVLVEKTADGAALRADTDGERLLVTFVRGSSYEHGGETDAYWMELPKV